MYQQKPLQHVRLNTAATIISIVVLLTLLVILICSCSPDPVAGPPGHGSMLLG